jgi:hypothetical protein
MSEIKNKKPMSNPHPIRFDAQQRGEIESIAHREHRSYPDMIRELLRRGAEATNTFRPDQISSIRSITQADGQDFNTVVQELIDAGLVDRESKK